MLLRSSPMVVTGPWPGRTLVSSGKRQQAGLDGVDDLVEVAAGQVGAADAAGKERVAGDEKLERGKMQADGALGVAGGVEHLGGVVFEADGCAVGQGSIGRRGLRGGNAQPFGLLLHHLEQGQVVFIQKDGGAGEPLQLERAAHVVDVGMGDENLLQLEAEFGEALWMRPTSSPGSMTMASWACSSPRRVQLQASGPTGKVSKIMVMIVVRSAGPDGSTWVRLGWQMPPGGYPHPLPVILAKFLCRLELRDVRSSKIFSTLELPDKIVSAKKLRLLSRPFRLKSCKVFKDSG